jgi:hypothetical protein
MIYRPEVSSIATNNMIRPCDLSNGDLSLYAAAISVQAATTTISLS